MFSHIMLGTDDIDASKSFYDATLGALGIPAGRIDPMGRATYVHSGGILILTRPINGEPACHANGGTVGFAAASPEAADAWHAAGLAAGGTAIENAPGVRNSPFGPLYLAYLRDPAGNKICAMHRVASKA
ncbi:VOC family protein [Sphingomonas mollis]|uniref:VOC family protein n=1 Tax=Sphingomonas mollis TaxID=2795726 RepID=A0ABS0XU09_9SPHN|nr:VOC family protein [Sphingomonas sp. BT553]MBJ6123215.1 VOC family protein [Sphingomonas sp. BT553]